MSNNSELRSFLKRIDKKSKEISSPEELNSALQEISSYERKFPEFKYNHKLHWSIFIIGVLASAYSLYFSYHNNLRDFELIPYLSPILIPVVTGILIYLDKSLVTDISNRLFNLDVKFDNGISDYEGDYKSLFSYLYTNFGDFERGDEQRKLSAVYKGEYKGDNHSFNYKYYKYHYVEVYYVTVKSGKTYRTERRTRTVYRYGLLLDFPFVKNLLIKGTSSGANHYKEKWETSSSDFESKFTTYCDNQIEATKFLKPAVILELLKLEKLVSSPSLEFRDKQLCLSFGDSDMISLNREHGIRNIREFIKEINNFNELKKLNKIFTHIDKISTYVDNNFKGE